MTVVKITANLDYSTVSKEYVSIYVGSSSSPTHLLPGSPCYWKVQSYNFSFHDRLEGNSHPLMASWAEISKQADVDCNNLKGEIRVGYLFPLMRNRRKLFCDKFGEFLKALEMLKDRAPSLDSFSRLLSFESTVGQYAGNIGWKGYPRLRYQWVVPEPRGLAGLSH